MRIQPHKPGHRPQPIMPAPEPAPPPMESGIVGPKKRARPIYGIRMAAPVFGVEGVAKACQEAMREGATWQEIKISFAGLSADQRAVMMPGPNGQPVPHQPVTTFVVVWPDHRPGIQGQKEWIATPDDPEE